MRKKMKLYIIVPLALLVFAAGCIALYGVHLTTDDINGFEGLYAIACLKIDKEKIYVPVGENPLRFLVHRSDCAAFNEAYFDKFRVVGVCDQGIGEKDGVTYHTRHPSFSGFGYAIIILEETNLTV